MALERRRVTESIGLRLNEGDLTELKEIARDRRVSLNSLISQIIDRYLRLWVYDHAFGFFSVNKHVLSLAFNKLSNRDIMEITDEVTAKVHKELIMYLYGSVNTETVLAYLDHFGTRFEAYKHRVKGARHVVTVFHGIDSRHFSDLYYSILRDTLELAKIKSIEQERDTSENGFSIVFDVPTNQSDQRLP
jgi:predicted DNA-binding ribbon-helix-helix protein